MSYKYVNTSKNQNIHRRTLRDHQKLVHWHTRNNSSTINSILSPEIYFNSSSDSDCSCEYQMYPTLPTSKVKRIPKSNNTPATSKHKTSTSKYHTRCLPRTLKPKIIRTPAPKPQIVSNPVHGECLGPDIDSDKNVCYCRLPNIPPLLSGSLFQSQSSSKKTTGNGNESPGNESVMSFDLKTLSRAKELLDYTPASEFLKRLKKEAKEKLDCQCTKCKLKDEVPKLKFTSSRQLLEEHYDEAKKYNINELFRESHKILHNTEKNYSDYKFTRSPRLDEEPEGLESNAMKASDRMHLIRHIRDENYFDCHSTAYLDRQQIPAHNCVHKFALDERLLPKPLNCDPYGVSRCTLCNKPMENVSAYTKEMHSNTERQVADSDHLFYIPEIKDSYPEIRKSNSQICNCNTEMKKSKSDIKYSNSNNKSVAELQPANSSDKLHFAYDNLTDKLKNFNKKYCSKSVQTSPRIINIASGSDLIHLINNPYSMVNPNILKMKQPFAPENSWALRYQKGMI